MLRYKRFIPILLEIPLVFVIAWQLWEKMFPLWLYLLASVSLGALTAIHLWFHRERRILIFIQLFLLAIFVRNAYFIATHYQVLPFADPYGQFGALRFFLAQDKVSIITGGETWFAERLEFYSEWPALQLIAIVLLRICDIDALTAALWVPWIFATGWFIFNYLLLLRIEHDLRLSKDVTNFALLVVTTSPFVFMPPMFYYQDMAMFLFVAILYIAYKQLFTLEPARNTSVFILFILALVLTHHYFSLITVMCLCILSVLFATGRYSKGNWIKMSHGNSKIRNPYFKIGIIAFVFLFLWWINVGISIWPYFNGFVDLFIHGRFGLVLYDTGSLVRFPECYTPRWGLALLNMRDIATYIPVACGFVLLLMKTKKSLPKIFVSYSLFAAAILAFVDALIMWAGPYRLLSLFAPLTALCAGIFYDYFKNKWRHASTVIVTTVTILLVFSSLIGLWAHLYVPVHLYDPKVTWIEGGEHPINWGRLQGFFDKYVVYENVERLLTDEIYALSLIVPPEIWTRIQVIGYKQANLCSNTITVVFRRLNVIESYHGQGTPDCFNSEWRRPEFSQKLAMEKFGRSLTLNSNLVYSNGQFQVWWH